MRRQGHKAFGVLLRHARERAGRSQGDVARFLGVSVAYISTVEHGHRAPLVRAKIHEVARFLDTRPDGLIVAASQWHGVFELPYSGGALRESVAAMLSARWERLSREQLTAIVAVLEEEEP